MLIDFGREPEPPAPRFPGAGGLCEASCQERQRLIAISASPLLARSMERLSASGRLCCKSRKLQGLEFSRKIRTGKQSPIRITSITLPKSPMSLTCGNVTPLTSLHEIRISSPNQLIERETPRTNKSINVGMKMSAREVWLINVLMKHDDELLRQINAEADRMCSLTLDRRGERRALHRMPRFRHARNQRFLCPL